MVVLHDLATRMNDLNEVQSTIRYMNYLRDSVLVIPDFPGDTYIPSRTTYDLTHLGRLSKGCVWHLLCSLEVGPELEAINVQTRTSTLQSLL